MAGLLRRWFRDLPIRHKLVGVTVVSSALGLVVAGAILIGFADSTTRQLKAQSLTIKTRILAVNSSAALVFGDPRTAADTLSALRAKTSMEQACLYGAGSPGEAELFASYTLPEVEPCPSRLTEWKGNPRERLSSTVPVELKGEQIGTLQVVENLYDLKRTQKQQVAVTAAVLVGSLILSFAAAWVMQHSISGPIQNLAGTARRVSEQRDYRIRATAAGEDEVGQLVQDFNRMLEQIARRDEEILKARDDWADEAAQKARANQELESVLSRLRETQTQLVQSEKMASLGGLVAGVAHEINTPVGVSVTAASTLGASATELQQSYRTGALRRSDLESFISLSAETTQIILKNLQRAADLIHSFKQVAVDQSSGESRRFHLKAYIDEVLMSLRPRLRKNIEGVTVDCPEDLSIESNPGALAQILTNFINNSLLHAYQPEQKGHLTIRASLSSGGLVTLRYQDDGCGIPQEHLKRIFDPFYTTKRGSGGSGLGMHIVFNLVTQVLRGEIHVSSPPGQGAEFTVTFPASLHSAAAP